jgi:predicted nucleic acid-binding protein
MTTYVLDASAILRFYDRESGWERVAQILTASMARRAELAISAIQWGEIVGAVRKKKGVAAELRAMGILSRFPLEIVPATAEYAVRAAELKVDRKIAYADAFAATLAREIAGSVLLTADYGFKAVEDLTQIEFLPQK